MESEEDRIGAWDSLTKWAKKLQTTVTILAFLLGILSIPGIALFDKYVLPQAKIWIQESISEIVAPTLKDLSKEVTVIKTTQGIILNRLDRTQEKDLLEINGAPIIIPPAVTEDGGTVAIGYSLRRHEDCDTQIEVRFIDARLQRINTSLSTVIPSVRSRVSEQFGFFVVDVRIPEGTPSGFYSYAPLALVRECDGYNSTITIPPSPFFEVVNTEDN